MSHHGDIELSVIFMFCIHDTILASPAGCVQDRQRQRCHAVRVDLVQASSCNKRLNHHRRMIFDPEIEDSIQTSLIHACNSVAV